MPFFRAGPSVRVLGKPSSSDCRFHLEAAFHESGSKAAEVNSLYIEYL
jgi:hypothetical protein